jgi:hypothetical protein
MMANILRETQIGEYTITLDDSGALKISTAILALTFPKEQAETLIHWLSAQENTSDNPVTAAAPIITPEVPTEPPVLAQDPLEAVQSLIDEAIANARANYPASLDIENRDRFVDQLTRDRRIRPYLSQGTVNTKQMILWVEQKLDTGEERIEERPEKKKRWSLF